MATLTKAQLFDRREWLNKVRRDAQARKVVKVVLRPNGATFSELCRFIGPGFAVKQEGDTVMVAVKQKT